MSPTFRAAEIAETGATIASVQLGDGSIPHFPGGICDPWNHIEAAMGLDVARMHDRAETAYRWLALTQRPDGAWAAAYRDGAVADGSLDANFCAYVAVGVLHHHLATADMRFTERMWPHVERAFDFVLELQTAGGEVLWARDATGRAWPGALLTSSSCIYFSLRCGIALAHLMDQERPDWELAASCVAEAVARRPGSFEPKARFSMDWYYPVLAGIITGPAAHDRLAEKWRDFVIEGRGARCVSDRPWVTAGETAELALALDVAGRHDEASAMFEWLQHLRAPDGGYWMGATQPDEVIWPRQTPTWCAGAALIAADALFGDTPTSGLFRGEPFAVPIGPSVPDPL